MCSSHYVDRYSVRAPAPTGITTRKIVFDALNASTPGTENV